MTPIVVALLLASRPAHVRDWSDRQILAMGRARWRETVAREEGRSRSAYANGEWRFGDAVAWQNARLLARSRHPARDRTLARGLRAFGRSVLVLADDANGGGTMWSTLACEDHADVEIAIREILVGRGRVLPRSESEVEERLRGFRSASAGALAARASDLGSPPRLRIERERRDLDLAWASLRGSARNLPARERSVAWAYASTVLARAGQNLAE